MFNRAIQSHRASAEKTRHPVHNYQSLGISHSFGEGFNNAREEKNQSSTPLGHVTVNHQLVGEVGNASDIPGPLKGFRNVGSRSASLTMQSNNYSNSKPSLQGYPISCLSQPNKSGFASNHGKETSYGHVLNSQLAWNFKNSNNALCISRGEFSPVHPATPLWAEPSHSTSSQYKPQGFIMDEGQRTSVPLVIPKQEKDDRLWSMQAFGKNSRHTDLRIAKQGYGDYQSDSVLLPNQEKEDIFSTFRKSAIPLSRKDDGSFLTLSNVSPKHNHSQAFYQEQHQGIQNPSQIGLFPSWSSSSKSEMLDQQHSLQTRFRSGHNMKSMGTFTPVNSMIRASEGTHMISERVHSLPNRERIGASFCKESRIYENSGVLDSKSCQLFGQGQQGTKLQLLGGLTDSGGIKSAHHPSAFLCVPKKKLSAETGALDMDIKENRLSGAKFFSANKDVRTYAKLFSTDASVFLEEGWSKPVIPEIPDLNIPLHEFPGADNLLGHLDSSTHTSKSSDKGSLHAVEPTTKTRRKRKMSDILNSGSSAGQENVKKSFRQIGKGRITKSELTCAGKEVIVLDSDDDADDGPALVMAGGSSSKKLIEVENLSTSDKNDKSPLSLGLQKTEEITPYTWFGSWPVKPTTVQQTAQENPEPTVVYKPQSSYAAFEAIRKSDVPGATAMAASTSVSNQQIDIKKKDKGLYKSPE